MKAYATYLKDILGMNYVGISIQQEAVDPYLKQLEDILEDKYELFTQNQKRKDMGKYHINIINSSEYNSLLDSKGADKLINSLELFFDKSIKFDIVGLGKSQKGSNVEYFAIVKSDDLILLRKYYNLPEKDFYITLGFYPYEVFGVRKNNLVPIKDKFLKLLSQSYYNQNQSFDFLKDLEFFDGDKSKDIEAIKIEDTFAIFRVEQNYFTVSLLGNDIGISARWQETKKNPILSDTIISRKLKNI